MGLDFHDRLLRREMGDTTRYSKIRGLYGDKRWVDDLDIVNELDGHMGCVNALSWSKSGNLLASGSDDTHVHIHSYLPENSISQFNLTTAIITGHTQNIFSVKFMPHSNDRTVVSASGDATVRVFDVEYSGHSARRHQSTEGGSRSGVFSNTQRLSEGDTNARVFRTHSDRVKRIVTESSPFYFLTCSEDGEVRQWDMREPESTYPAQPRTYFLGPGSNVGGDQGPPPLISYKRYQIDLNTISCSPSRPHYIALGGNHLHCFLHDRRMLGRDRFAERGAPSVKVKSASDDDEMGRATQCVRRFAPHGQPRMGRTDVGHITACKISDADPNEVLASWSGDHIYSFNVNESPDALETQQYSRLTNDSSAPKGSTGKARESPDRKRKRVKEGSSMSLEAAQRGHSRARTEHTMGQSEDLSLRVNYGNGQREDIPIGLSRSQSPPSTVNAAEMPDFQRQSLRIAKGTVRMRKCIFSPLAEYKPGHRSEHSTSLSKSCAAFSRALNDASSILPEIEDVIRSWRYPVNPAPAEVTFQKKLRQDREASARFVQAGATLARVLGGKLRTLGGANADAARVEMFLQIRPALNEAALERQSEQFHYDFLKAICLWLDSGPGGLVRGFTKTSGSRSNRFPITPEPGQEEASIDAIDDELIPYLLSLASTTDPILNIDASPYEVDDSRVTFDSGRAAVLAFAQAVKIPFEDLTSGAIIPASPTSADRAAAQDRQASLRFWGFKVGRGLLMNASEGVNFQLVDTAFGGLGRVDKSTKQDEKMLARLGRNISAEEDQEDGLIEGASIIRRDGSTEYSGIPTVTGVRHDAEEAELVLPLDELAELIRGAEDEVSGEEASDDNDDDEHDANEDEESDDDDVDDEFVIETLAEEGDRFSSSEPSDTESEDEDAESNQLLFRSGRFRSMHRSRVNAHVPVGSHTRTYAGHCNIKTVKDVNFYGLQDEYVVSGSDSGHLFIWDRKSTKLVNILEGDGEVVNVVQGHPYEPMLAVSGIDNTIKIFNSDSRARRDARLGAGVRKVDESEFSSIRGLGLGRRRRRTRAADLSTVSESSALDPEAQAEAERRKWAETSEDADTEEDGHGGGPPVTEGGLSSRKRMWDEYRITSSNDSARRGNSRGEYISVSSLPLALSWILAPNMGSMMHMLLGRLREQIEAEGTAGAGAGNPNEPGQRTLVIDEDRCATM